MAEGRIVRPRARPARDRDDEREEAEREYDDEYDEPAGNEPDEGQSNAPRRRRSADSEDSEGHRQRSARRADGGLTAARAGKLGLQQIAELTGKQTEGVTWVQRSDEDGWAVGVEVVEDRRVPSAADILAIYETELDPDGELVSYRRVRRYSRGRGDDGDGGR